MTNDEILSGVTTSVKPKYDLEERTACFGRMIIAFAKKLPANAVTTPIVSQIVRSATSVESRIAAKADDAVSKKEFRLKIGTCKKEARETKHWLRMAVAANPRTREEAKTLWHEARELHLIFAAILRKP